MPQYSRSDQRTSWNVFSSGGAAVGREASSGAASRAFVTPRPVPVLNQSWAEASPGEKRHDPMVTAMKNAARDPIFRFIYECPRELKSSSVKIKPELDVDIRSRIGPRQRLERARFTDRTDSRSIHRIIVA